MGEKKPSKYTTDDLSDVTVFRELEKMKKFILDNIYGKLVAGMQFDYGGEKEPNKITLTITFNDDTSVSASFEMNTIQTITTELEGDVLYLVITMTNGASYRCPIDTSNFVTIEGNQTVTGDKLFTGDVQVPDIQHEEGEELVQESNKAVNERFFKIHGSERIDGIEDEIGDVGQVGTIRGDIATNDANAVHKTGNETIDGVKTLNDTIMKPSTSNVNYAMILRNNNPQGTIPANDTSSGFYFRPSDTNVNIAVMSHIINKTTGDGKIELSSRNYNYGNKGSILLITPAGDNPPYATCPARAYSSDNNTDIVNNGNLESRLGQLTKSDVGLGNVDNTSDLGKPISTATQVAIGEVYDEINRLDQNKQNVLINQLNIKSVNGSSLVGSGDLIVTGDVRHPTTISELLAANCIIVHLNAKITATTTGWNNIPSDNVAIEYNQYNDYTIVLTKRISSIVEVTQKDTTIIMNAIMGESGFEALTHASMNFHQQSENGEIGIQPLCFNGGGCRWGNIIYITDTEHTDLIDLTKSYILE